MATVQLIDHPLVQHKLTLMRRKDASTNSFRQLLHEVSALMAYEVLTAFFLEAGFLGVMLFGVGRVGRRVHFAATLAVACVLLPPMYLLEGLLTSPSANEVTFVVIP